MRIETNRTFVMLAGVLVILAALLAPHAALAQQSLWPGVSGAKILGAPRVAPLDQELRRFYERERRLFQANPLLNSAKMIRRLYRDPLRDLGFPENKAIKRSLEALEPELTLVLPAGIAELDRDNNGTISRIEYIRGRNRHLAAGPDSGLKREMTLRRYAANFRRADIDGNGVVSAQELASAPEIRF
jgi:hypothetical protein